MLCLTFALFVCLQYIVSRDQSVLTWLPNEDSREGRKLFEKNDSPNKQEVSNDLLMLEPNDRRLIHHVETMIHPPSSHPYNLTRPDEVDYSRGQSLRIDQFLHSKEKGIFIEIGAFDGETHSVSLYLEKYRQWIGLLIEPRPNNFRKLLHKHRKASALQACVKTNSSEGDTMSKTFSETDEVVPCFFMETIIKAHGFLHINMLSVDAKDQELDILKTVPFEKVLIDVITVEFSHGSSAHGPILKFLDSKNYTAFHQFVNHPLKKSDLLFVRNELNN
ncbi:hypothetical protein FSP39_012257 [Pinctada imbricata]|uniref:Methyltransferase FkbM domain-containing protein n=1 Tax=Pinctada imbricata TaxID=66713 RepID=A0AA88Y933_PINIB|nr:hypothetical protein FSP39_012257 [Pinctada imbricata]